jgi:hypothetical protein
MCVNMVPPVHENNGCLDLDSTNLLPKCIHSKRVWKPAEDKAEKTLEKPGPNLANLLLVAQQTNKPH